MARWESIIDDHQWTEDELSEIPRLSMELSSKFIGGYQVHPHVEVNGIDIDNALVPLISTLWQLGFETFACCQGRPVDYHVSMGATGHGYILFTNFDSAAEFLEQTAKSFSHDDGIYLMSLHCMEDGKASVQFPPLFLDRITKVWADI